MKETGINSDFLLDEREKKKERKKEREREREKERQRQTQTSCKDVTKINSKVASLLINRNYFLPCPTQKEVHGLSALSTLGYY